MTATLMQHRVFGEQTGLKVSHLALGTGISGTARRGSQPEESARIFHGFADTGGNFIDTSGAYQLGQAETLIGEFPTTRRDGLVIACNYSRSASAHPPSTALGSQQPSLV